jgi:hypothetical protein
MMSLKKDDFNSIFENYINKINSYENYLKQL